MSKTTKQEEEELLAYLKSIPRNAIDSLWVYEKEYRFKAAEEENVRYLSLDSLKSPCTVENLIKLIREKRPDLLEGLNPAEITPDQALELFKAAISDDGKRMSWATARERLSQVGPQ